ncbi:hypothetical protein CBER1_09545 [Cercospora berteroae]|uniref:Required for respiratory growth protein 7, mitochondrial n=1 Tax=Cercospora berteroae TaxID=357750 RepID=A0A2S6C7D5_9PEZI|nr:hypothetical protein CBER1_09545 [Cercospora berteroae]
MLARHVLLRQRLKLPKLRRVSTVSPKSRRPSTRIRTEQTNEGLNSFIHHFAPQPALEISSAESRPKPVSLQQHLAQLARARTKHHVAAETEAEVLPERRGRKRREPGQTKTVKGGPAAVVAASRTRKTRRSPTTAPSPPRVALRADQTKHHDLATFQAYAAARNLNQASTVFRGTNFEYMVRQALSAYHFDLHRTGKANDLGIDLLGQWSLPQDTGAGRAPADARVLKVLIQCKLSTAQPCNVRELEGAHVGAPSGWRGDGVMSFLVSSKPATAGVRAALQRSRLPMGFLQITEQGQVRQFIWNNIAQEARLVGMSATSSYACGPSHVPEGNIALVYQGRPL